MWGRIETATVAPVFASAVATRNRNPSWATTPGSILDRTYHYSTLGFYAQDDVRVRPNFTLNVGLRYEFNTTYQEQHNHHAALRDIGNDPTTTIGASSMGCCGGSGASGAAATGHFDAAPDPGKPENLPGVEAKGGKGRDRGTQSS